MQDKKWWKIKTADDGANEKGADYQEDDLNRERLCSYLISYKIFFISVQVFVSKKLYTHFQSQVSMALDVKEKLLNILKSRGQMNHEDGLATIQQMRRTGRLMEEYFG